VSYESRRIPCTAWRSKEEGETGLRKSGKFIKREGIGHQHVLVKEGSLKRPTTNVGGEETLNDRKKKSFDHSSRRSQDMAKIRRTIMLLNRSRNRLTLSMRNPKEVARYFVPNW